MDSGSLAPLVVVGLIAAVSCAALARFMAYLRGGGAWRLACYAVAALVFVLTLWPVVAATVPTDEVAEAKGIVGSGGVTLPPDFHGPVRVLVRGAPAGDANAEVRVDIAAGAAHGDTILARRFENARVGKTGRMTVERDAFAKVIALSVPDGTAKLEVRASGANLEASGLTVRVYRDICPLLLLLALDAAALAVLAALGLRGGEIRVLTGGGALLGFALAATVFIEPGAVTRPIIGAVLIGGVGGAAVAGAVGALVQRLMARPVVTRKARTA